MGAAIASVFGERQCGRDGVEETDPERGSISWISSLARALLSGRADDKVRFPSPAGEENVTILTGRCSGD